jgi:hypothetical protein
VVVVEVVVGPQQYRALATEPLEALVVVAAV